MNRPRVITHNVVSVDARLTIAPGVNLLTGDERWSSALGENGDPYRWPRETHDPQLLLEGRGSFVTDAVDEVIDSGDPVEGAHFLPESVVGAAERRWFAVVDGRGAVDVEITEWPDDAWRGWHALVLTSLAAPREYLTRLRDRGIPYLVVGQRHVALPEALHLMQARLGVRTVVCTGGGRLGGALLRQGLIDEVDLELLPVAIGGRGTPALFDAAPLGPREWPTRLELVSNEALADGRVHLRYRVVDADPADR